MARIIVSIPLFEGNKFVRRQITNITNLSEGHLEAVAKETAKIIKEIINRKITRVNSTGNLEDSFYALPITNGWGVGDIAFLNHQAPYWYWQNYGIAQSGRTTPPPSSGQFTPGNPAPIQGGSGARWEQPGAYFINPTKPIQAKNYIEETIIEIPKIVRSVTGR